MPVYNPPTYREQCTKVVGFDAATCDYVCDGVADEVQINQAIAAVVALGGGTVALQRGTYNCEECINLQDGVCLRGAFRGTVIQASTPLPFLILCASATQITDCFLYSNDLASTLIYFENLADVVIANNIFVGSGAIPVIGIDVRLGLTISIQSNIFISCDKAILVELTTMQFLINNNLFKDNNMCIVFGAAFGGIISNNLFYATVVPHFIECIHVGGYTSITSNIFYQRYQTLTPTDVVRLAGNAPFTGHYTVTGNMFELWEPATAIHIEDSYNSTITGNVIHFYGGD